MSNDKKYILDEATAERKLRRMALEILEQNAGETGIVLAGIRENGSVLAVAIQQLLRSLGNLQTELVHLSLDKRQPAEVDLDTSIDFTNKVIIVIDDVANSGRTLLYAMKPFLKYQPKKIQVLVLVGRSHNSFPVHPDYTGVSIATTLQEHIFVEVAGDKVTGAYLQ